MEINIAEIKQVLNKILDNTMSREEASGWAYKLRQEADNNKLKYCPIEYENILWNSILFIEGVDLQNEPNVYFHNEHDIMKFLQNIEEL